MYNQYKYVFSFKKTFSAEIKTLIGEQYNIFIRKA